MMNTFTVCNEEGKVVANIEARYWEFVSSRLIFSIDHPDKPGNTRIVGHFPATFCFFAK